MAAGAVTFCCSAPPWALQLTQAGIDECVVAGKQNFKVIGIPGMFAGKNRTLTNQLRWSRQTSGAHVLNYSTEHTR